MANELSDDVKKAHVKEAMRRLDHDAFFTRLEQLGIKASDEDPGAMIPIDADSLSRARDCCQHKEQSFLGQNTRDWELFDQQIREFVNNRRDNDELEAILKQVIDQS
ncbi:MAG: hypothetical protein JNJ77_12770 [Planctomycetia bacterium]|nr:hypothetical protein [Planctomycetia bacterium]